MGKQPLDENNDEARRLDREYTGDAVNARTDELDKELQQDTHRLQRKYEEGGAKKDQPGC